jgi:predicted Zn-dependent protease
VNAFAAPGGFIHITRGALGLIQNEAELAGVLGHEITHVTEKHTISAIKKNNAKEFGMEMSPSGGLTKAVISKIADRATDMVLAGFGRSEELESDEKGVVLTNTIGYAPTGLGTFLTRLTERNKDAADRRGLFASHPEMQERLDRLQKEITTQKLASTAVLAERYKKNIAYEPKPQAEIAQVEGGAAGLASGGGSTGQKADDKSDKSAEKEQPKKKGFGLGSLMKPGGEEKKSAQVTGSGGARGVDPERNAKGGSNPTLVAVNISPADLTAFKKEGNLK